MQRAEKLYQKNQLAMQQQYTETLEAKNRQLEEALDQADIHGLRLMVVEDNELNAEIT